MGSRALSICDIKRILEREGNKEKEAALVSLSLSTFNYDMLLYDI
jgi:hypothetical protein